jgi:hypothetical protein
MTLPYFATIDLRSAARGNDSTLGYGFQKYGKRKLRTIFLLVWSAYAFERPETSNQDKSPKTRSLFLYSEEQRDETDLL